MVPLKQYSEEYPWVIAAMEEQDGEMEKQRCQKIVGMLRLITIQIQRLRETPPHDLEAFWKI